MPLPLLAGALIGPVAELAKGIMDKIWPPQADPNLKLQAQAVIEQAIQQRENALVTATQEIIVAEMAQGDTYTKRARPTVVYAGLGFILFVYILIPVIVKISMIALLFMRSAAEIATMKDGIGQFSELASLTLPSEFWWAWSGVVGIWSIGRTFERKGQNGAVIEAIVGK
jgi:hypothetical protein